MDDKRPESAGQNPLPATDYVPPTASRIGDVAELTGKSTGASDGSTFLGVEIGS